MRRNASASGKGLKMANCTGKTRPRSGMHTWQLINGGHPCLSISTWSKCQKSTWCTHYRLFARAKGSRGPLCIKYFMIWKWTWQRSLFIMIKTLSQIHQMMKQFDASVAHEQFIHLSQCFPFFPIIIQSNLRGSNAAFNNFSVIPKLHNLGLEITFEDLDWP